MSSEPLLRTVMRGRDGVRPRSSEHFVIVNARSFSGNSVSGIQNEY